MCFDLWSTTRMQGGTPWQLILFRPPMSNFDVPAH